MGLWCKLKRTQRSVFGSGMFNANRGSSSECRVAQFHHRRIAPAELAHLELPS